MPCSLLGCGDVFSSSASGTAFVLDEDGSFLAGKRFHSDFLTPHWFAGMTDEMKRQLESMIRLHREKTGSVKAEKMLENWPAHAQKFLCLVPIPQG